MKARRRRRVIVIGIDAMDRELIDRFIDHLPNIRRLAEEGLQLTAVSTFPPDTPVAWATIYTGLNPARHGIIRFVDPLEKISLAATEGFDNLALKGRTFWDIASANGRKVCVLLPHLGYPVWAVNGVMVGRSTNLYGKHDPIQVYPPEMADVFDYTRLFPIRAVPKHKFYSGYIEAYRRLVKAEAELGFKMMAEVSWDIIFLYFSTLDWLGHNLWMFFDEKDPAYPGPNPYKDVFLEFYEMYDAIIGEFIERINSDTILLVLSDHGMCIRPYQLVNINEVLKRMELLVPKIEEHEVLNPYSLLEFAKRRFADFVNRRGAGQLLMKITHKMPILRKIYTFPQTIDWSKTIAYTSDLSGIKAYSYGGIIINKELVGAHYDEVVDTIICELKKLKDPVSNKAVFKWICGREDLYSGEYMSKYPDIIFELRREYGVGWSVNAPIFDKALTHNVQSGSHRTDTPIFYAYNLDGFETEASSILLEDIAPSILNLLGVKTSLKFDGKPVFTKKPELCMGRELF